MCGIAGVVAWDDSYRAGRQTLEAMSAAMAHRGPDGRGIHLSDDEGVHVALAHRRLAIIDPDPRADQPLSDSAGRVIVFNGEIYNFQDLRRQLDQARASPSWRTHSDTEVLLAAYGHWGRRCVERLNGMFAFAIWDRRDRTLFLARDRMGQKPLYYAIKRLDGGEVAAIAFASEIAPLRRIGWIDSILDLRQLTHYLRLGYTAADSSIYSGIAKLPPAHRMLIGERHVEGPERYFDPNAAESPARADDRAVRDRVIAAVRGQLVADVPVGCFLSGGIDSSIVAAAMRASVGADQQVLTFSIGFDDPRYDETAYAAEVARHLGTTHRQFMVRPDAAADLPRLAAVYGEPFADSSALPTHYLSRQTRQFVKVALSGDGGDELFGGYDRYRAMQWSGRIPRWLRSALAHAPWRWLPGTHPKSRLARLKRMLKTLDAPPETRYAGYLSIFDSAQLEALMDSPAPFADPVAAAFLDAVARGGDEVAAAMAADRVSYLPEDLLTKVDRASMLHGLEVRSPFMDHELVRFAAMIPSSQLLAGGGKAPLRRAFAPILPRSVFTRKKMGFAVPIGRWFQTDLRAFLRETLGAADSFASGHFRRPAIERLIDEHETGVADHSQRLYALLMLELWHRWDRGPAWDMAT